MLGTDQVDEGDIGGDVGNNDRRADLRAVAQSHPGDVIALDENPLDLGAVAHLAAVGDEQFV